MNNFNNSLINDKNTITNNDKSLKNDTNSKNVTNSGVYKNGGENILNLNSERIKWQKKCTEYDWSIEKGW